MAVSDLISQACAAVRPVAESAGGSDLGAATPCQEWDLRTLVNHFVGTSGAFARLGRGDGIDPADPWGSKADVTAGDWAGRLADNLAAIGEGWASPQRWEGSVDTGGHEVPMKSLGELGLIEVILHGWDLARTTGQPLDVPTDVAAELLRCVSRTAELGRKMEAYGPAVQVDPGASDLDRALGLAGRDPFWGDTT